jgi:hypothetical protein
MVGENLGKGYVIIFVLISSKCRSWTWHPLFIIWSRFGKSICLSFDFLQGHYLHHLWVNAAKSLVVLFICSREVHLKTILSRPFAIIHSLRVSLPCVVFESMLPNHWSCRSYVQESSIWNLYWVGHLQLSILSVSAFPMSSPIHIILCFTFKICYSFCVIDGGYIKALLWRVLFRRLQLIIRNQDLENLWYLGACMPQW